MVMAGNEIARIWLGVMVSLSRSAEFFKAHMTLLAALNRIWEQLPAFRDEQPSFVPFTCGTRAKSTWEGVQSRTLLSAAMLGGLDFLMEPRLRAADHQAFTWQERTLFAGPCCDANSSPYAPHRS